MTYNPNIRRLYVHTTTGEERSPRGREPFMEIELKSDGFEYVTMANARLRDAADTIITVKPHGTGWERYDTSSEKWWVWRRKALPS